MAERRSFKPQVLLRGLERVGVIPSADEVLHDMLHPPARR